MRVSELVIQIETIVWEDSLKAVNFLTMSITLISLKLNTRAFGPVAEGRQNASDAEIVPTAIR